MSNASRTLSVRSPAIPLVLGLPALEPVRLSGHEGLDSLFAYELLLKTPDALNLGASGAADFDLDGFIGREIACSIKLDGGSARQINALITDAGMWGEEGRHVQYKLTLRPWLHLATLRTDCKIFQNKTVVEILDELLAGYAFPVDKRLFETYPVRDYQTQFNESDFDFFSRLSQEWGISYHFEHSEGKHRLVLCDAMGAYRPQDSAIYREVEYHAPGWKLDAEYIHSFVPSHRLTSGRYATKDYDYTRPRANLSAGHRDPRSTGQSDGEVYQWHHPASGSHYAQPRAGSTGANNPQEEGRHLALLRMQALRTHGSRAQASGHLRGMVPGRTFSLAGHPRASANTDYLVLDTHLLIEDVAQDSQNKEAVLDRAQRWRVNVDFTAHPAKEPLRPALTRRKPVCKGPQTALVVGPEGQNLWTDEYGRIKVQFPWDRIGQKNLHSSCWVRVSSPWAGNQLGATHIPRIGQEVIVSFIGGDPDLPLCTGRVHNQANQPPWALPGQSALSGFRSRTLTSEGGNSAIDNDSRCDSAMIDAMLASPSLAGATVVPTPAQKAADRMQNLCRSEVQERLTKTICKFPTEWAKDQVRERWMWTRKSGNPYMPYPLEDETDFTEMTDFAQKLCFWEELPEEDKARLTIKHWHFHPRAFVNHFRKCAWLSEGEFRQLLPQYAMRLDNRRILLWEPIRLNGARNATIANHRTPLNITLRKWGVDTPLRRASFFGNSIQETQWWALLAEGSGSTLWYAPWYGRGFLQLTNPGNYIDYWRYRGRTVPESLRAALVAAYQAVAGTPPARRSNAGLQDSNFPALTAQMREWRSHVGAEMTGRSGMPEDVFAPADSAGYYWAKNIMSMEADAVHTLERVPIQTDQGARMYYRSSAFWRASATVNLPGAVNRTNYTGINGFDARCVAYGYALAVLTEIRFPSAAGNTALEFPETNVPRR
ncbi:type VI secretion system tip protein TssI/VgrG [Variovorax sp. GB1P17]|uniref:type VI secretion system tip protein TssI/VgrG n=1 Tax=Variovorax sp. GB1P17 TaxID=3443740 RepID=UPI003F4523A0